MSTYAYINPSSSYVNSSSSYYTKKPPPPVMPQPGAPPGTNTPGAIAYPKAAAAAGYGTWTPPPPPNTSGGGGGTGTPANPGTPDVTTTTPTPDTRPPWDPETDPAVMAARGYATEQIGLGQSKWTALDKALLIGFGSQSLAQARFGGDPFTGTVSDDPNKSTSWLANEKRMYGVPIGSAQPWNYAARYGLIPQAEEKLNQSNLWFGSEHAGTLSTLNQQKLMETDAETRRVQGLLAGNSMDYAQLVSQMKQYVAQAILQAQANWRAGAIPGTTTTTTPGTPATPGSPTPTSPTGATGTYSGDVMAAKRALGYGPDIPWTAGL